VGTGECNGESVGPVHRRRANCEDCRSVLQTVTNVSKAYPKIGFIRLCMTRTLCVHWSRLPVVKLYTYVTSKVSIPFAMGFAIYFGKKEKEKKWVYLWLSAPKVSPSLVFCMSDLIPWTWGTHGTVLLNFSPAKQIQNHMEFGTLWHHAFLFFFFFPPFWDK